MMQSFLQLLLATCACQFTTSAVTQEDRTAVLPYKFRFSRGTFLFDHDGKGNMALYNAVQKQITSSTCITFRKINSKSVSNENYFFFEWNPQTECNSMDIKEWNCKCRRTLTIGRNCATTQLVLLNLLRGLGFDYQHKRQDRDKYVRLSSDAGSWYDILEGGKSYGLPFDPVSIMHPVTKSAREGLIYKDKATERIVGKAKKLSFYDKKGLNTVYQCDRDCPMELSRCLNEGYRVQTLDCKCQCKKGFWGERCEKHANTHHLHKIFALEHALLVANEVKDNIASAYNHEVANEAVNTIKDILHGISPTSLHTEEMHSRDVFATILGELSFRKWGASAVSKLGGKADQMLEEVLKGHLPHIIPKVIKHGGSDIVGRAFGNTLAVHFTRSLGRAAVCVVKKAVHDIWSAIRWIGAKLKSGCQAVFNALKNAAGKLFDKIAMDMELS